jgi:hypothetical protein
VKWQASEPVEQEGLRGLLYFAEPHCYAPFLLAIATLGFGLMGMAGLWKGVNLAARLLATVLTVGGCLVIIQGAYEGRHKLRETELLARVRTGRFRKRIRIRLSAQLKTILTPVLAVGLILLLAYVLVQSDVLWKLADWLLFEHEKEELPPPEEGKAEEEEKVEEGFKNKVIRALPLILMGGYVGLWCFHIPSSCKKNCWSRLCVMRRSALYGDPPRQEWSAARRHRPAQNGGQAVGYGTRWNEPLTAGSVSRQS